MPPCTPEKHLENLKDSQTSPFLGFVTPPRRDNKNSTREEQQIKSLTSKLPTINNIFDFHGKIGQGTFSTVILATLRNDSTINKRLFAVKHLVPTTHPKRIEVELNCLKKIGGESNVVGLDFCLREGDNIVLIMPYLQHDHFTDYVYEMDASELALYVKNLLVALKRVHSFGIIHRDVKPNNFLYDRRNKRFLLIDFGLAQMCTTNAMKNNINSRKRKRVDNESDTEIKGKNNNNNYKRPALLQNKNLINLNTTIDYLSSKEKLTLNSKENLTDKNVIKSESSSSLLNLNVDNNSKSQVKMKGQRKLFDNDEVIISSDNRRRSSQGKKHSVSNKNDTLNSSKTETSFVGKQISSNGTNNNKNGTVVTFQSPQITQLKQKITSSTSKTDSKPTEQRTYCKCYGKSVICTVCIVRKCPEAPRAGTPGFRPPEVLLKYPKQTTAVDIWAVGIIMLCVLCGTYPFFRAPDDVTALAEMITIFGDEKMRKLARKFGRELTCSEKKSELNLRKICCRLRARGAKIEGEKCDVCSYKVCVCVGSSMEGVQDHFPDLAYDLLYRLLDVDPNTRITAEDALNHPFLNV